MTLAGCARAHFGVPYVVFAIPRIPLTLLLIVGFLCWTTQSRIVDAQQDETGREALAFPGVGRVEVARVSPAVPPRVPAGEVLDRAELRARLLLAQSGVDMKGARVSSTPAAVRIEMASVPLAQQSRIAARLTAIDHVQVDFHPGTRRGADAREMPLVLPGPTRFGLRHWLDRNFRDRSTRGSFFPRLIRSLTTVHQRIGLLAELARRYPDPQSGLSASTRPMLQQLIDQHYRRLRRELNESRVWVAPLSGAVHVVSDTSETPAGLVARAPEVLTRMTALEQRVYGVLRQNDLSTDDQQGINAGFADLWQAVYGAQPVRP